MGHNFNFNAKAAASERMARCRADLQAGDGSSLGSDSLTQPHSSFFKDDGETGYFYALDLTRSDDMIVDAVQIFDVANVSDRERASAISILWSADGMKCALLINDEQLGASWPILTESARREECLPSWRCHRAVDHAGSHSAGIYAHECDRYIQRSQGRESDS
jgi:hypothetical protein